MPRRPSVICQHRAFTNPSRRVRLGPVVRQLMPKLQHKPKGKAFLVVRAPVRGLSFEVYLEHVLPEGSRTLTPATSRPAERIRLFETWAQNYLLTPPMPDEAVSRENLIRDAQLASSSTPECC
jgi:hypothetical protein